MNRNALLAAIAFGLGLLTFLVLGQGQADKGDELIYGVIVAALAWWIAGKLLPKRQVRD